MHYAFLFLSKNKNEINITFQVQTFIIGNSLAVADFTHLNVVVHCGYCWLVISFSKIHFRHICAEFVTFSTVFFSYQAPTV